MADDGRPPCRYGASCYRKNPDHLAEFWHPPPPNLASPPRSPSPPPAAAAPPPAQHQAPKRGLALDSGIAGKTVCFSGGMGAMKRNECRERALQLGARVVDGVSSRVDVLFVGDTPGGKLDRARELGVTVMDEDDWVRISAGGAPQPPVAKRPRAEESEEAAPAEVPGTEQKRGWRIESIAAASPATPAAAVAAVPAPHIDAAPEEAPKAAKPRCKYGAACYRTGNPAHCAEFSHDAEPQPAAPAPSARSASEAPAPRVELPADLDATVVMQEPAVVEQEPPAAAAAPQPVHMMQHGEVVDVPSGTSGATYQIKRVGDHYYCTCIAWKQQSAPVDRRSCKHLRTWLGCAFEDARVGSQADALSARREANAARMPAPPLLLANRWDEDAVDPTRWWISEKLDGVRAYWDGKSNLLSRAGNPFPAPGYFFGCLPQGMALDGELWSGRGTFQTVVSIVRSSGSPDWRSVCYHVFDAPGLGTPFEARLDTITDWFDKHPCPHVRIVPQVHCEGRDHLFRELRAIEQGGGEGLMIRKPGSSYVSGRSSTLLKVKTFLDAEARVVGHEPGKGKYAGMTGALHCVMASGKKFKVGSGMSDRDRVSPPAVGTIISYRFQELTEDGVPRFPAFIRVRPDVNEPADAAPKKRDPGREED